jgi:H+-transporting ATPase
MHPKKSMACRSFLIVLALSLAVVMVAVQLHRGDDFFRIAEYALLLLVAAIPVAMPAVLSMTMAMGAKALAVETPGALSRYLISLCGPAGE